MISSRSILTRRNLLVGLSVIPLAALKSNPTLAAQGACLLTPEAVEGPYYFDPALVRSDITEGGKGLPLGLVLQAVDDQCRPLNNARVDLWHADARGYYSGYSGQSDDRSVSTVGQTFMRGTQFSDASGLVRFRTVYPGWYRGRTTHIHFKVFLTGRTVLTGQLYFPDLVNDRVYSEISPYKDRNLKRDTDNADDGVLRESGEAGSFVKIIDEGDKFAAAMTIGIASS